MKKCKILSIALAVVMLLVLTIPAFAVTPDLSGHDYVAYQIFKGTQIEGDEDGKLACIEWGDNIDDVALMKVLRKTSGFLACNTAEDVAKVVSGYGPDSEQAREFSKLAYQYIVGDGIPVTDGTTYTPGYYLVVDVTEFGPGETDTVRNMALLQVTGNGDFDIDVKVTVPSVIKEVFEESESEYQSAADYDIGDQVPFRLTAQIGEDISAFDTYKLIFHDTLSAGLFFGDGVTDFASTVRVYLDNGLTTKQIKNTGTQKYIVDVVGNELTVTLPDVISLIGATEGDKIVVEYVATLTEEAEIGVKGNPNEVTLEYSNNPNDETETGKTPKSEVEVYTWGAKINKVTGEEENLQPLAGAKFSLFKKEGNKLVEVAKDVEVVPVYDSTNTEIISYTANFKGLDSGTYVLSETVVPAGYNGIEDIEFTITTSFNGEKVATFDVDNGFVVEKNGTEPTGYVLADIINNEGIILPETGGIGSTIFYVLGTILLLGSAVVIITKKRVTE